jgi:hypothetical protein
MKILKGAGIIIGGTLILFLCVGFIATVSTGVNYITKPFEILMRKNDTKADREVFENGQSHIESVARDLAKEKKEYDESNDETSKKAIVNYINETYADFDVNNLDNATLRQFLKDVRNGNIK